MISLREVRDSVRACVRESQCSCREVLLAKEVGSLVFS